MKNSELFSLQLGLQAVAALKGLKFAIAVAKNTKMVTEEIQTINEEQNTSAPTASEEFIAYDTERVALAIEYSDKDDEGKPIIQDRQYSLDSRREEFDAVLKVLQEENADAIEAQAKSLKEFNAEVKELMDTESTVTLVTVQEESLPEDITAGQLLLILPMLED